jgi:hypothetical protein
VSITGSRKMVLLHEHEGPSCGRAQLDYCSRCSGKRGRNCGLKGRPEPLAASRTNQGIACLKPEALCERGMMPPEWGRKLASPFRRPG